MKPDKEIAEHHSGYNVKNWDDYIFPDWVPIKIRDQIKSFWSEGCGRSPHDWAMSAEENAAPQIGEKVFSIIFGRCVEGRYIHAWNNIGRIIEEDGSHAVCSVGQLIDYSKRITDREAEALSAGGINVAHAEPPYDKRTTIRCYEQEISYMTFQALCRQGLIKMTRTVEEYEVTSFGQNELEKYKTYRSLCMGGGA